MREFGVGDAKKLPLGITVVLLEASGYATNSAGVWNWSANGGVHMVLKIGDKIVQPLEKKSAGDFYGFTFWWFPFTPFQILTERALFTFPEVPNSAQALTVTVISGTGRTKEKQVRTDTLK